MFISKTDVPNNRFLFIVGKAIVYCNYKHPVRLGLKNPAVASANIDMVLLIIIYLYRFTFIINDFKVQIQLLETKLCLTIWNISDIIETLSGVHHLCIWMLILKKKKKKKNNIILGICCNYNFVLQKQTSNFQYM